ncbi:hypothetical protein [Arthrobacter koreensis]|uniref:hypothetical protein n=1 Tax=Arthrobacter koreensis TaxID=199136 RepID=UPI00382C5E90
MSISILGFKTVTALPADADPALDNEGLPMDRTVTRAYTPFQHPSALDGLVGGHDPDPLTPHHLGSRWYQLGEGAGATFDMSSSRLTRYRDELLEFHDGRSGREPFHELIHVDGPDAMIGPEACKRLAADFKAHPWVSGEGQVHSEINEMIHDIAEHGGCLVFCG